MTLSSEYFSSQFVIRLLIAELETDHNDLFYPIFTTFILEVKLTEFGSQHLEDILEAIYSYLELIAQTPMSKHREIYETFQRISENKFNFQSDASSQQNVQTFATAMTKYADEDVLRADDLFSQFDEVTLTKYMNHLNSQNFVIIISDTDSNVVYDKVEEYYKVEYAENDVPASFKRLCNERTIKPELKLPSKNDFICTQFDIHADGVEMMVRVRRIRFYYFRNYFSDASGEDNKN